MRRKTFNIPTAHMSCMTAHASFRLCFPPSTVFPHTWLSMRTLCLPMPRARATRALSPCEVWPDSTLSTSRACAPVLVADVCVWRVHDGDEEGNAAREANKENGQQEWVGARKKRGGGRQCGWWKGIQSLSFSPHPLCTSLALLAPSISPAVTAFSPSLSFFASRRVHIR